MYNVKWLRDRAANAHECIATDINMRSIMYRCVTLSTRIQRAVSATNSYLISKSVMPQDWY